MSLLSTLFDTFINTLCCCIPNSNLSINGRAYRILKLLGEGGFSFVYLAEDGSGNLYALKKIRCTLGNEEAELAEKEIDKYQLFSHKNIIQLLGSSVVTESDGTKTIYMFLPYYQRGNLQDAINKNNLNKTHFPQKEMLVLFLHVCDAVKAMHTYTSQGGAKTQYQPLHSISPDEESRQDKTLLLSENTQNQTGDQTMGKRGELLPWAHRDIKPGNVLLADDGETPILMDFGSACPARIPIETRQEALSQQDLAAEQCTMPYRAPELFDVKVGTTLDEKVDIWSLGCTLYAMAYGQSPFEMNMEGGSVALAVLNNQYKFPENNNYSADFNECIKWMLNPIPNDRPDIHEVISRVQSLINT
ncbi:Pkinase-domain-containing protein [Pilobolus umbonatus]|nr:Pkinase-domain-containing protein [Pilobolus umbonatus]